MTINERIQALAERHGVDLEEGKTMPMDFGTKQNMKVGGGGYLLQRFPVTLYAPSWLKFLQEGNIEAMLDFLEENEDSLSWGK